jgi:hypothetical protein
LGQTPLNNNLMFSVQFNSTNPSVGVGSRYIGVGTTDMNYQGPFNGYPGTDTFSQGFSDDGNEYYNGNILNSGLPTWTSGDIIDIALRPNDYWFIRVNGGYWNNDPSADPTTGVGQINLNISSGYPVLCPSIYGSMTIQNYPTYGVPSGYLFLGNVLASVKFFRTSGFTDNSFIDLSEYVSGKFSTPQTFTGATEASTWLTTNGFWNSYSSIVTTNLQLYLQKERLINQFK